MRTPHTHTHSSFTTHPIPTPPLTFLSVAPAGGRRLWQHVTESLREKDIEKATEQKRLLEERQRSEERHRAETETPWRTRYFDKEVSGGAEPFNTLLLNWWLIAALF